MRGKALFLCLTERWPTMTDNMTVLLDESGIKRALTRISHEILERNKGVRDVVLIGIRSGGAFLAGELARSIKIGRAHV